MKPRAPLILGILSIPVYWYIVDQPGAWGDEIITFRYIVHEGLKNLGVIFLVFGGGLYLYMAIATNKWRPWK